MADFKMVDISLSEATALTEISYPNPTPHPDVTLLIVAYNEEERIGTCSTRSSRTSTTPSSACRSRPTRPSRSCAAG